MNNKQGYLQGGDSLVLWWIRKYLPHLKAKGAWFWCLADGNVGFEPSWGVTSCSLWKWRWLLILGCPEVPGSSGKGKLVGRTS